MASIELHGLRYHVERSGSGSPIVLLHGFTGSVASWTPRLPALQAAGCETIAVDLPGHGATESPPDPARYGAEQTVADLVLLLDRLGIERAVWLGYSMGGRMALQVAMERPERVSALILESGSPGIGEPAERDVRARADGALADRIERDGIESFVNDWQALPMFASHRRLSDAARAALRRQRLRNRPIGLANSLRGFGQGVQPYLGNRLSELAMPVCLIAGDEDEKYRRLAGEMAARIAGAEVAIVANCGHTPHLEQPEQFDAIVTGFLERMQPAGERMETT